MEDKGLEVVSLLFGAFNGDVGAMRRSVRSSDKRVD